MGSNLYIWSGFVPIFIPPPKDKTFQEEGHDTKDNSDTEQEEST